MADQMQPPLTPADPKQLRLRLMPSNHSDVPIVSNTTIVLPGQGFVYVDFGFIDPALLPALGQMARQGSKLPDQIDGRLAARVALSFDVVQQLHQQLGGVLQHLRQNQPATQSGNGESA
jgi:hypothetical protein